MDKGRSNTCKSYAYYFYVEYIVEYICCHDINYLISRFNEVKKCAFYLVKNDANMPTRALSHGVD